MEHQKVWDTLEGTKRVAAPRDHKIYRMAWTDRHIDNHMSGEASAQQPETAPTSNERKSEPEWQKWESTTFLRIGEVSHPKSNTRLSDSQAGGREVDYEQDVRL